MFPKIAAEWHPTKNGELTSDQVAPYSNKRAHWQCARGHEWEAIIENRTRQGHRCQFCSGRRASPERNLAAMFPKIAAEWHPTKNGSLTPDKVAPYSGKRAHFQCARGHEWEAVVISRTQLGAGCLKCKSKTSQPELRLYTELKTIFPDAEHRARICKQELDVFLPSLKLGVEFDGKWWHSKNTKRDREKVRILKREAIKVIRLRGRGLPRLSKNDVFVDEIAAPVSFIKAALSAIRDQVKIPSAQAEHIQRYIKAGVLQNEKEYQELLFMLPGPLPGKSLLDLYPKIAAEWHHTKNGSLTPDRIFPFSHEHVFWLCTRGHTWLTTIADRTRRGGGCQFCSGRRASPERNLATEYPAIAAEWHPTKNGSLTPDQVPPYSNKRADWMCKYGHTWPAVVSSRTRQGLGCPFCSGRQATPKRNLAAMFPKIAAEWHPTKNGSLTPDQVTPYSSRRAHWKCARGHGWEAPVAHRTGRGDGCRSCRVQRRLKSKSSNVEV